MIWTIPNILTFARILAAPALALIFVLVDRPAADWIALGLFVFAAVTDFLDGWLARRLNQVSEIGKMLDPIADKVMVIVGLMVVLALAQPMGTGAGYTLSLILIPAAIIGLREVLIAGVREYLGDVKLPVTRIAKWKTTVQLIAVTSALLLGAFEAEIYLALWQAAAANGGQLQMLGPQSAGLQQCYFLVGLTTVALLWLAAVLTALSGWDYMVKAIAYIREREAD